MHFPPSPSVRPDRTRGTLACRRAGAAALLALLLGACRADSIVTPDQPLPPACDAACAPSAPAPDASIVIAPLEDAATRILPHMLDARARAELATPIDALRVQLLAGRLDAARLQLARAYDAIDLADHRLSGTGATAVVLDLADLSAIRLALVPASAALGVAVP